MKKLLSSGIAFISVFAFSQENPEVYVLDIAPAYAGLELLNFQNISNDPGYDNQPFFSSNETVLFAGNKNGQTDIAEFNLNSKAKKFINIETAGGEYSPQKFPSNKNVAAVRLDADGLQRLYRYNPETGKASELMENLRIAYFAFYNDNKILATVLNDEKLDLVLIDIQTKTADTLLKNAGRSLQKVPKTNLMSYTLVNEAGNLDLYLLDMNSSESYFVCELPIGVQDYVWINDTQLLIGSGNKLFMYDTLGESRWNQVASLEEFGIKNSTRLAISPNGKRLALVAEPN